MVPTSESPPGASAPERRARPSFAAILELVRRSGWMHTLAGDPNPVPRVFCDHAALHAHALADEVTSREGYTAVVRPWFQGLATLLAEGARTVVLEGEGGVEAELERRDLVAITAALALAKIERGTELHVVLQGERVYYHRNARGERCAFAFTSRVAAEGRLADMRQKVPDLRTGPLAVELVCEGLLGTDAERLLLDPGLACGLSLERDVLEVLRATWSTAPVPAPSAPSPPSGPETAAPAPSAAADRPARASAARTASSPAPAQRAVDPGPPAPAVARRPVPFDPETMRRVSEVRAALGGATGAPWVGTELLAGGLDLWVPVDPEAREWPACERVAGSAGEVVRASAYTREETALTAYALRGLAAPELSLRRGSDALRWIWSSPRDVTEVLVDQDDPAGPIALDRDTLLAVLFPAAVPVPDLARVPELAFEDLAGAHGVHGLAPTVVSLLVRRWTDLLGPALDGTVRPVPHGDAACLPVFTHRDRFFDFARRNPGRATSPHRADGAPPFLRWLRLAVRCDGLVVDPDTEHAFTLDPSELFYLQLWAETGRAPEGAGVVRSLRELLSGDYPIDQRTAGRIAADWPFFVGARAAGDPQSGLVAVPETDDLALFTGAREIEDFGRTYGRSAAAGAALEPAEDPPRWRRSFFDIAHERFSGIRIDAGTAGSGPGVHLDGKGLDGALERLEERLSPRARRPGA